MHHVDGRKISLLLVVLLPTITDYNCLSDQANKGSRHLPEKRLFFDQFPQHFSHLVNFQHNHHLLEMAMKECHPKGLKVQPLRDFGSPPEAFLFWG
jgi:hypothetical protein